MKVTNRMLHKLFSFTTALMHDWKMYGDKKENGDIEIKQKLLQSHFQGYLFGCFEYDLTLHLLLYKQSM